MNRSNIQEKICPSKAGTELGDGGAREKGINPRGEEQHTNDLIQTLHKDSVLNSAGWPWTRVPEGSTLESEALRCHFPDGGEVTLFPVPSSVRRGSQCPLPRACECERDHALRDVAP